MGNGWIKLHRKLQAKGYYKNSQYVHLWVHLLLLANHTKHEYMHDGGIIHIKEGQMVTGRKQLSEDTGIPQSTIEDILKLLEKEHQIQQQKTNKYRIITILNWVQHQNPTALPTSGRHLADTYKNDKKEKNISESAIREERMPLEEDTKSKIPAKYPHSKEVFSWFPRPQKSWESMKNVREREHAEFLYERGEEKVRQALRYVENHKDDEYFYQINSPYDLETKWLKISDHAKRNR